MHRKLVILYTANYCNKMRNVFEVEKLIKDFEVEFWNLSKITAKEKLTPTYTEGLKEIDIDNLFLFFKLVKENSKKKPVYASVMGYSYFSYKIFLILSLFNSTIVAVTNGTLPSPMSVSEVRMPINMRFQSLFARVLKKTPLIKPADYALISSKKARVFYKIDNHTKMIYSNSGDYIDAINIMNNQFVEENPKRYVVFLDQYTPFHGDYKLLGLKTIEEGYYYEQVNSYLKKIENNYECEVIIAAHPSATKYKEHNYFEGRKVVFNQTALLVLNSIGVLTHNTTAVSYAAIYKKPIIFMNIPGFCNYDLEMMKLLSQELKSKIVDITRNEDAVFEPVNEDAYQNYRINYLSLAKDGMTNAIIFSELLCDN